MPRPSYAQTAPRIIHDPENRLEKRNPIKWYNPMYKMRAKHRARQLDIVVSDSGTLQLQEQAVRLWNHPVSAELQNRFLQELETKRRLWHAQDRGDMFANGAIAAVHFEGDSRTTLALHSIPGLMNRRTARREFIGMVERVSQGMMGPRRSFHRLGGDGASVKQRANG